MARFVVLVVCVALLLAAAPGAEGKALIKRIWRALRGGNVVPQPAPEFAGLAGITANDISQCMASKPMKALFKSQDMIKGGNKAHAGSLMLHHFWTAYYVQHLETQTNTAEKVYTQGLPQALLTVAPAIAIVHDIGKVDPETQYPTDKTQLQPHLDKPHDEYGRDMLLGKRKYALPSGVVDLNTYLKTACPTVYTDELLQLAALVIAVHWKVGTVQTDNTLHTPAERAQSYANIFSDQAQECGMDLTTFTASEKRHMLQLCIAITAADVKAGQPIDEPAHNVVGQPPVTGNRMASWAPDLYSQFGYMGDQKGGPNIPKLLKEILKIQV